MELLERALVWLVPIATLVALGGWFRRARYRSCVVLGIYLAALFLGDFLYFGWPAHFYNARFWFAKELAFNTLELAMAFELGVRIFRAFPGARASARFLLVAIMVATTVAILPVWPHDGKETQALVLLQARFLNGSVWLFSGLAAVILWYRLPIDGLQKAILVGIVPYLLASTAGLNFLNSATTPETWTTIRPLVNTTLGLAYLGLISYWGYVIWKPASETLQAGEPAHAAKNATQPL